MRIEDQTYEKMMNSLTNHSLDMIMIRAFKLMGQERQEDYTYISVIVLLILLLFSVFAACTKNTTECKADLHRALEIASDARIQQMVEMSDVDFKRHERLLHGDNEGPGPVLSIGNTQ